VREYDLGSLRSAIRVVPQDTFLFSTSVRENIAFGAQDGDSAAVEQAASISTIQRDLGNFPQGWETVVGERGVTLSGGQKQRVALSRALAGRAAIYILDDAMSSVDTETEEAILTGLLPRLRGSTVILISHRVSTLRNADRIVVLENGRLTQDGTPAELATAPGFYADILRLQQLEESLKGHR